MQKRMTKSSFKLVDKVYNPQGSTNNLFLPSSALAPNKILWLFALAADKNGC